MAASLLVPLLLAIVPSVSTTSLAGNKIELPRDLHGPVSFLILGFSHKSADQATEWGKAINSLEPCHAQPLTWYQMPVLAGAPGFVRPMILRSMKSSLTPDLQQNYIPIINQENEWRTAAGYQQNDDAYLLAVNQIGQILAKWHGPVQASQSNLQAVLQQYCRTP